MGSYARKKKTFEVRPLPCDLREGRQRHPLPCGRVNHNAIPRIPKQEEAIAVIQDEEVGVDPARRGGA